MQVVVPHIEDSEYTEVIISWCLELLTAKEVRVRHGVAVLLGALARKHGNMVWEACQVQVMESILYNFVRSPFSMHSNSPTSRGCASPQPLPLKPTCVCAF